MFKQLKKRLKERKGFTLVELIVVIAILAILAAVLVPSLIGYVADSRAAVGRSDVRSAYTAATAAYTAGLADPDASGASGADDSSFRTWVTAEANRLLGATMTIQFATDARDGIVSVTFNNWKYTPNPAAGEEAFTPVP